MPAGVCGGDEKGERMSLRKIFGGLNVTWPKVIVFAIIAGVYTGVVNQIPALANTSFADIALTYECWVLFAVLVATNCASPLEAGLKTFVFFAISQPVVFLVEVPTLGFSLAFTYLKAWLIPIVLTFPGGMLAYLMKRRDWLGAVVVAVAVAFLGCLCAFHMAEAIGAFPRHLLTVVFCLAQMVVYPLVFLDDAKQRALSAVAAVAAVAVTFVLTASRSNECMMTIPAGEWTVELSDPTAGEVVLDEESFTYTCTGTVHPNTITLTNEAGDVLVFDVEAGDQGNMTIVER